MEHKNIFSFNVKWDYKTISLFLLLILLPNLLGLINISTPLGFKIHFFQLGIFIAAFVYGPFGGVLSGFIGSFYSAMIMNNPYIAVGNAILGFFAGLFFRYDIKTVYAVLIAYLIQLPWLIITDYYFAGLSVNFIGSLVVALLISNVVWAIFAHHISKFVRTSLNG